MSRSSTSSNSVSVYSGRTRLGSVRRGRGGFIAIDVDGGVVGKFETQREAADVLEETAS